MSNLIDNPNWEAGVYQLETADPVLGGPGGISNLQPQQLANRTAYLKQHVDALETAAPGMASIAYVQGELEKLGNKQPARAATTANITLSGLQVIDGVSLIAGDRVLVKNQTLPAQNGIYVVSGSGWARSADANDSAEIPPGFEITISEGTGQADTRWRLVSDGPLVIGMRGIVGALTHQQFAIRANLQDFVGRIAFHQSVEGRISRAQVSEHFGQDGFVIERFDNCRDRQLRKVNSGEDAGH